MIFATTRAALSPSGTALLAATALLCLSPAFADEAGGNAALAIAARVGEHSPLLTTVEKMALETLLDGGDASVRQKIVVRAAAVDCLISNVAIARSACAMTFADKPVSLAGREAQALYATLIQAGVQGDGAAGTIHEAVKGLDCVIDPVGIGEKDGGGANCRFSAP